MTARCSANLTVSHWVAPKENHSAALMAGRSIFQTVVRLDDQMVVLMDTRLVDRMGDQKVVLTVVLTADPSVVPSAVRWVLQTADHSVEKLVGRGDVQMACSMVS